MIGGTGEHLLACQAPPGDFGGAVRLIGLDLEAASVFIGLIGNPLRTCGAAPKFLGGLLSLIRGAPCLLRLQLLEGVARRTGAARNRADCHGRLVQRKAQAVTLMTVPVV